MNENPETEINIAELPPDANVDEQDIDEQVDVISPPIALTDTPVIAESPINPLLSRAKMPGEVHRLPSWGYFYNNGELDESVENGEVHIHPLSTMDEINISSPALLYSGDGIIQAIRECIPSIKKPEMLLAQDVDFLMLCLRKVSYGASFEFIRAHDECEKVPEDAVAKELTYQANLDKVIAASKVVDIEKMGKACVLKMPVTNQVIKFEPLRFKDYVKLMQAQAHSARKDIDELEQKNMILDQLSGVIAAVDEITDREMIREWLEVITAAQVREINKKIDEVANWGVNTTVKVKCRDCKKAMEVDLPTSPLMLFS